MLSIFIQRLPKHFVGTCWSGNWTLYHNDDDGSDGVDSEQLAHYQETEAVRCPEISAIDVQIVGQEEFSDDTIQDVTLDQFSGFTCNDADQERFYRMIQNCTLIQKQRLCYAVRKVFLSKM